MNIPEQNSCSTMDPKRLTQDSGYGSPGCNNDSRWWDDQLGEPSRDINTLARDSPTQYLPVTTFAKTYDEGQTTPSSNNPLPALNEFEIFSQLFEDNENNAAIDTSALGDGSFGIHQALSPNKIDRWADVDLPRSSTPKSSMADWATQPSSRDASNGRQTAKISLDEPVDPATVTFVKSWVTHFPETLPSTQQIQSLGMLASVTPQVIESVLANLLRESASTKSDSSYHYSPLQKISKNLGIYSDIERQDRRKASEWLARQAVRCKSHSRRAFEKDKTKLYQCTLGCGSSFGRKDEWKRHEETVYPQEGWVCFLCTGKQIGRGRVFRRKEHLGKHSKTAHKDQIIDFERNRFTIQTEFPKDCMLCNDYHYKDWQHRCEHVSKHLEDRDFDNHVSSGAFKDNQHQTTEGNFSTKRRNNPQSMQWQQEFSEHNWAGMDTDCLGSALDAQNLDPDVHLHQIVEITNGTKRENSASLPSSNYQSSSRRATLFSSAQQTTSKYMTRPPFFRGQQSYCDDEFDPTTSTVISSVPHTSPPGSLHLVQQYPSLWSLSPTIRAVFTMGAAVMRSTKNKMNIVRHSVPYLLPQRFINKRPQPAIHQPGSVSYSTPTIDLISERPTPSVTRTPLRDFLLDARIGLEDDQKFVPVSTIRKLITKKSIQDELGIITLMISEDDIQSIKQELYKIFAILVVTGKPQCIVDFLHANISDNDLPFEQKTPQEPQEGSKSDSLVKIVKCWDRQDTESFFRNQWTFIAPVFEDSHHTVLSARAILPFIPIIPYLEHHETREGGFSKVSPIRIHSSHHCFSSLPETNDNDGTMIAIKKLISRDRKQFEREASVLRSLSKPSHPHLIKLLATYEQKGAYHLIFPFAKSNLREYWRDNQPTLPGSTLFFLEQMRGLVSALQHIHGWKREGTREDSQVFGRHGDIKPENILFFDGKETPCNNMGTLALADFGLTRFHGRRSRSMVNPTGVGGSQTYVAPEVQLGSAVSRAYDIWTIGCVFLEFIIWILTGSSGLVAFHISRCTFYQPSQVDTDTYYDLIQPPEGCGPRTATVKKEVIQWIDKLRAHPHCSTALHDALNLLQGKLLVVDISQRATSPAVESALKDIIERAKSEMRYLSVKPPNRDHLRESSPPDSTERRRGEVDSQDTFPSGQFRTLSGFDEVSSSASAKDDRIVQGRLQVSNQKQIIHTTDGIQSLNPEMERSHPSLIPKIRQEDDMGNLVQIHDALRKRTDIENASDEKDDQNPTKRRKL